jgi:hypothetical protein
MEVVVQRYSLANATWNRNAAAFPGQQVTLQVTAPDITAKQHIEFRVMMGAEVVDVLKSQAGQATAQWTVPNIPGTNNVTFTAIRREPPSPGNGHQTVLATLTSAPLQVHGFSMQLTSIDEAFVPSRENLHAVFTVTDPAGAARNGRYEIWGERYPGDEPAPLYTENFVPAANNPWNTWNGRANAGVLSGHFLTPEFSPYRLRITIGQNQQLADDPMGAGLGLVACIEAPFEVKFKSIEIRVQQGVVEKSAVADYTFANALAIEPPGANGTFAATGRLATFTADPNPAANPPNDVVETMRLRIPVARHQDKDGPLDQDEGAAPGYTINTNYTEGSKKSKFKKDSKLYSRPEIPIEFVPKLASRDPGTNPNGVFQADAVGFPILEPVAEEHVPFAAQGAVLAADNIDQQYWRNAAFNVKKGNHKQPWHGANNLPEFHYWTVRMQVQNAGQQDFTVTDFDLPNPPGGNSIGFLAGQDELVVYLNRTLLTLSKVADDSELNIGKKDYRESAAVANGISVAIRLRPNLTKVGDILWIVRKDSTASGTDKVDRWTSFPPGPNCHLYYGGVRGEEPTPKLSNYFRAAYSKQDKKRKPIIGLATADFPYKKYVNLEPDKAKEKVKVQERVEVTAMPAPQLGLAGVIFSPSITAGDSYIVWAWLEREAYRRRFGFVEERPALKGRTGIIKVWRWARIKESFRLPDIGTNGLCAGVAAVPAVPAVAAVAAGPGVAAVAAVPAVPAIPALPAVGGEPEAAGRPYSANGRNMTFIQAGNNLALNTVFEPACHDWAKIAPANAAPGGAGNDPTHASINLAAYRAAHNRATNSYIGYFPMNADTDIKNYSVAWDFYRELLPPGLPNLPNLIANTIAALPAGTSSRDAGLAVQQAITGHGLANPDVGLNPGVSPIPPFSDSSAKYVQWFDGIWDEVQAAILDALIPKVKNPEHVNALRWPGLHEESAWKGWDNATNSAKFNGMTTLGFSSGDAQSMFRTADLRGRGRVAIDENTFPHEMGHSLDLFHFVAANVAWKHHDVNNPNCLMSYKYTTGFIRRNDAATAARGPNGTGVVSTGATLETGFPHLVPADNPPGAPFPSPAAGASAANAGENCIQFGPNLVPLNLCAKCCLKLRGWNDELLPFAWRHPDLF